MTLEETQSKQTESGSEHNYGKSSRLEATVQSKQVHRSTLWATAVLYPCPGSAHFFDGHGFLDDDELTWVCPH